MINTQNNFCNLYLLASDVKTRLHSLRSYFMKELSKTQYTKSGQEATDIQSGWQFFNSLLFLKDSCIKKNSRCSLDVRTNFITP